MSSCNTKLPNTATDGQEVLDKYGSIWRFDGQTNTWTNVGKINDSPVVTETKDGLISPPIFTRINAISTAVQNGLKFDYLKINPHLTGYYYFFQSSNHTITFEPESPSDLRIEVSRPRLLSLLSQIKCPGAQGLTGNQGEPGIDGSPGEPEEKYAATIIDSVLQIDNLVDNSLGTPISLRVFAGSSTTPVISIKIIGTEFEVLQSSINIDLTSTFFDYYEGRLTGQITSSQWGDTAWSYKVSQMGKKGPVGNKGSNFVEVVSDTVNDENLRSNRAIILIRQGNSVGLLNYFATELFKMNCVSKLSIHNLCSTITFTITDSYAALQATTDSCKNITRFTLPALVAEMPKLVFSEWTPVETCLRQRHFAATKYSWPDFTKVGSSMMPWQQANQDMAADPSYPWSIIEETEPGQLCCQEDFFFCQNVNDVTGACPVNVVGDLQTPDAPAYGCDCDCPISFLLEGGYLFEDVNIRNIDDKSTQVAVCSLNGDLHEYNITVNVSTDSPIVITVDWLLEYDPICDESRELYLSQISTIPDFSFDPREAVSEANCPISWTIRDQSEKTATLSRQSGDNSQTLSAIGTMSFNFTGTSGAIVTSAEINLARLNCCLGYRLTVSVVASSVTGATGAT